MDGVPLEPHPEQPSAQAPPDTVAPASRPLLAWRRLLLTLGVTAAAAAGIWGSRITVVSIQTSGLAPDAAVRIAVNHTLQTADRWCWHAPTRTLRTLVRLPGVVDASSQCRWPQRLHLHVRGVEPVAWRPTTGGRPVLVDATGREWPTPPALASALDRLPHIQGAVGTIPHWLAHLAADAPTVTTVRNLDTAWVVQLGGVPALIDSGTTAEQLRETPRILTHAQQRDSLHWYIADLRWAGRVMLRRAGRRDTTAALPDSSRRASSDAVE